MSINENLIIYYAISLLMVLPSWVTYKKAGLKAYLSFALLIPYWSMLISLALLAFLKWLLLKGEK